MIKFMHLGSVLEAYLLQVTFGLLVNSLVLEIRPISAFDSANNHFFII